VDLAVNHDLVRERVAVADWPQYGADSLRRASGRGSSEFKALQAGVGPSSAIENARTRHLHGFIVD
jgi:hypothetical protein